MHRQCSCTQSTYISCIRDIVTSSDPARPTNQCHSSIAFQSDRRIHICCAAYLTWLDADTLIEAVFRVVSSSMGDIQEKEG